MEKGTCCVIKYNHWHMIKSHVSVDWMATEYYTAVGTPTCYIVYITNHDWFQKIVEINIKLLKTGR